MRPCIFYTHIISIHFHTVTSFYNGTIQLSIAKARININVILCFELIKLQPMRINRRLSRASGRQKMRRFPQINKLKVEKESMAKHSGYRGDPRAKVRVKNGPAKSAATINADLGYTKSYTNIQNSIISSNYLCRRM